MTDGDGVRVGSALSISVLLHTLLFSLLTGWVALHPPRLPSRPIEVDLQPQTIPPAVPAVPAVPAPQVPDKLFVPEQQIVSPSEGGEAQAPEQTRLLSDRDTRVKEERIHRGQPQPGDDKKEESPPEKAREKAPAKVHAKVPARAPANHARDTAESPPLPDLDKLLPGAVQLARRGLGKSEAPQRATPTPRRRTNLLRGGGGWTGPFTRRGILDFLPDVREGDVTLLNTKAERFAPFVRRVAVRVFGHLVILLRRQITPSVSAGSESATVEAVMNRRGDIISITVRQRSTHTPLGIDRTLTQACEEGFFDRNPPEGAETDDGNIHFILSTQLALIGGPNGRLLGYRGVFSAGLE